MFGKIGHNMIKKLKNRNCYLTPDFPKEALMVSVFFTSKIIPLMSTPLTTVAININGVIASIKEFTESAKISKNENAKEILDVFDIAMITPIIFQNLYPLKKEFWTGKKDPSLTDRIFAFVPVLNKLQFYRLMVVPFGFAKKKWEFIAYYPFNLFDGNQEVEKYLYGSDHIIDKRAKYVAFYSFGTSKRLNWKTGEISMIENTDQNTPTLE